MTRSAGDVRTIPANISSIEGDEAAYKTSKTINHDTVKILKRERALKVRSLGTFKTTAPPVE